MFLSGIPYMLAEIPDQSDDWLVKAFEDDIVQQAEKKGGSGYILVKCKNKKGN